MDDSVGSRQDCSVSGIWYKDGDRDRYGDPAAPVQACTMPDGYSSDGSDCDDHDWYEHPGAIWYFDSDGDGFGDPDISAIQCLQPEGFVSDDSDCDDADPLENPDAVWFIDADGDSRGSPDLPVYACECPEGAVFIGDDCDDSDPARFPSNEEGCDGRDNDCDGLVDEDIPDGPKPTAFADGDGDGYGDPAQASYACIYPAGYVESATDCDDTNFDIHPDAPEYCDGLDTDCDGLPDSADPDVSGWATFHADSDGDGYGGPVLSVDGCVPPPGYVSTDDDCADNDANVHPGATETCDGRDEDCDGLVDEDLPTSAWYVDADGDGYGAGAPIEVCSRPEGYSSSSDDCDEGDATVHPGATEDCDGVDQDCDGLSDLVDPDIPPDIHLFRDSDGDGFGDASTSTHGCTDVGWAADATDCDDSESNVWPGAPEICGDGLVDDCEKTEDHARLSCVGNFGLESADAIYTGSEEHPNAGYEVAGIGDVNGDGVSDVAVAVRGVVDEREGYVVLGFGPLEGEFDDSIQILSSLGYVYDPTGAGDTNGDGVDDLVVLTTEEPAEAYLLTGPLDASASLSDASASFTEEYSDLCHYYAVAGGSDVDQDGFDDLLMGCNDYAGDLGKAYYLRGPFDGSRSLADADAHLLGVVADGRAGYEVAFAGDTDGDGHPDLLVAAPGDLAAHGGVYLVRGPVSGVLSLGAADAHLLGEEGDLAGYCVSAGVDVNGDGYDDVFIGAPYNEHDGEDVGSAYLQYGPISGDIAASAADARLVGEEVDGRAGRALSMAADADGDGFGDLWISAYNTEDGGTSYLVLGPVIGEVQLSEIRTRLVAESGRDRAGFGISADLDNDSDGLSDVLIGAPWVHTDDSAGAAYLVNAATLLEVALF